MSKRKTNKIGQLVQTDVLRENYEQVKLKGKLYQAAKGSLKGFFNRGRAIVFTIYEAKPFGFGGAMEMYKVRDKGLLRKLTDVIENDRALSTKYRDNYNRGLPSIIVKTSSKVLSP